MDIRIAKTEAAVKAAFYALRSKKNLEKITVKELCTLAKVNKSTFYAHYADVYALSEAMQRELVGEVLETIAADPIFSIGESGQFVRGLFRGLKAHGEAVAVLFSGKEQGSMVEQLEKGIKTLICREYPGILNDTERQAVQSYTIYGGYYAYRLYHEADEATAMRAIEKISDRVRPLYSGG